MNPQQVAACLERGAELHRRGELGGAESEYRRALAQVPDHPGGLFLLGVLTLQRGRPADAAHLLSRSLERAPGQSEIHLNLGNAKLQLGRPEEALQCYRAALALDPRFVDAQLNRVIVLRELKRPSEALEGCDPLLQLAPSMPAAHDIKASVLVDLGRHEEALASYREALRCDPGFAQAWFNQGTVLQSLGRDDEAVASYDEAIARQPGHAQALTNLGNVLVRLGRLDEALSCQEAALARAPANADILNNHGITLLRLQLAERALASFEHALRVDPRHFNSLDNRGAALMKLDRVDEALACFDQCLALHPEHVAAMRNRARVLALRRRHEEAAAGFVRVLEIDADADHSSRSGLLHARLQSCDWRDLRMHADHLESAMRAGALVDYPWTLLMLADSPELQYAATRCYARHAYPASLTPFWNGERYEHDRPRIAYLSADLHEHATAYLMAELLESHDRDRFEIFAVSYGPQRRDAMRARLAAGCEHFMDVRLLTDREIAQRLRDLEIDIAIDLKGYTTDGRPGILACRPAPLQVSFLGYPGTLGADYIDYQIADQHVVPPADAAHYAEKLLRLDCYQPNDSRRPIAPEAVSRAAAGLPEQGFVFCCFNNSYKLSPRFFDIWMRLLQQVPGSVLWLLDSHAGVQANLRREAAARDVGPERLHFAPKLSLPQHLARHRLADLFLDTLPYGAHTTASDALWAGLPLLTCTGRTFAGRVATSLLRTTGLDELVTSSLAEYESRALQLARNPVELAAIRKRVALARTASTLFDGRHFCRDLETALSTIHARGS